VPVVHKGESSEIVVDAAIKFIEKSRNSRRPFFAVVWFGSPHGPYIPLESDREMYLNIESETIRNRLCEITAMDRAIGKLRDSLAKLEVTDDTLLWYCSDNGVPKDGVYHPKLNGTKGTLLEGGIRVPGIIQWPKKIDEPRTTSVPCVTSDILPTVCDVLGLGLPNRPIDGISLVPLLEGNMTDRPVPIAFWKYDSKAERDNPRWLDAEIQKGTTPTVRNPGIDFLNFRHPEVRTPPYRGEASLMTNRHKLIISSKGKLSLYDLIDDPGEKQNLSDSNEQLVENLSEQLRRWQASVEVSLTGEDYLP
jgi:arylsulfatase A-like enzyme